jgi:hypothetical protein
MASTAQVCLPYSGVEKERMRSRAVRTHIAQRQAHGRRAKLYGAFLKFGANLLRAVDPMERCRIGSPRLRERRVT